MCEMCMRGTERLEAHHVQYRPEKIINICHACHFKIHHQPQQLTQTDIYKLMCRLLPKDELKKYNQSPERLVTLYHSLSQAHEEYNKIAFAPSRKAFQSAETETNEKTPA